eukprot:2358474-Rhodomonas_salina.2
MSCTDLLYRAIGLRTCYAMSGTEIARQDAMTVDAMRHRQALLKAVCSGELSAYAPDTRCPVLT